METRSIIQFRHNLLQIWLEGGKIGIPMEPGRTPEHVVLQRELLHRRRAPSCLPLKTLKSPEKVGLLNSPANLSGRQTQLLRIDTTNDLGITTTYQVGLECNDSICHCKDISLRKELALFHVPLPKCTYANGMGHGPMTDDGSWLPRCNH